jgi:hypothetical protein
LTNKTAKKTIKKLDDNVVRALTKACEEAKLKVQGFDWLTHSASYDNFPASLVITCVFQTKQDLEHSRIQEFDIYLRRLIQAQLLKVGIVLKNAKNQVRFDTEEGCHTEHGGNWKLRLK